MYFGQIQEVTSYINDSIPFPVSIAVILGSGLGTLEGMLEEPLTIPYAVLPGFPRSTVEGHEGRFMFGHISGHGVLMMSGRLHYYEGYSMKEVTLPVRIMQALGIQTLLVSNAAGGINRTFNSGDIMLINDHINLFPENPLRGENDGRLGTRFPDMSEPYCTKLLDKVKTIAAESGIPVREGVYAGLSGPSFETRAECRWLETIGADAVGMSTVPEVIVASHAGIKVLGASIITNMGLHVQPDATSTHAEVLDIAGKSAANLSALFSGIIASL